MNFENMRIGRRLALYSAAFLLIVATIVGIGLHQLGGSAQSLALQNAMDERATIAREWSAKTQLNVARAIALAKAAGHAELGAALVPQMKQTTGEINALQARLEAATDTDEGKALMAAVATRRKAYIALREQVMTLAGQGAAKDAATLLNDRMLPASEAYLQSMQAVVDRWSGLTQDESRTLIGRLGHAQQALGGMLALALAAGIAMSWATSRSISAQLGVAVQAAVVIAGGDLSQRVGSTDQSEIGDLLRALGGMQDSLRTLVGQVHSSTDSIRTASTEIAVGNQDLSNRTEQTASNLQLAATSIEQLTGTVQQSAESARQANALAGSAAEVAARGGQVVSQVVETMDDITASSQKIADITGVIDGIAFQTNILALNAAVEAARAGEQGRGFAVVAGEVRALARRSAEAAREIKTLIGASVEKVSGGSRLVADAGRTMTEIVDSVQRVSQIIGEISTAAHEQSQGIGEVNGSVSELDQMTQQNAALVEQSAAAAESLKGQAATLSELISTFRLGDAEPRARGLETIAA